MPSEERDSNLSRLPCFKMKHLQPKTRRWLTFGVRPIWPRSPMLIEHRPGHLNKGPILSLNYSILRGNIRRGVLVFKTKITAEVVKMRVLEFCAIVTVNRCHGMFRQLVLQPQDQIAN